MNPADTGRLASDRSPPTMRGAAGIIRSYAQEEASMLGRLGKWWKRWREQAMTVAGLHECGDAEFSHVARDIGLGASDLKVLAGKWPDAADLVERRAAALDLDTDEIARTDPEVMRDLERVCSLCGSKRACEHDLCHDPRSSRWQDYCPNAETLAAIGEIRKQKAK